MRLYTQTCHMMICLFCISFFITGCTKNNTIKIPPPVIPIHYIPSKTPLLFVDSHKNTQQPHSTTLATTHYNHQKPLTLNHHKRAQPHYKQRISKSIYSGNTPTPIKAKYSNYTTKYQPKKPSHNKARYTLLQTAHKQLGTRYLYGGTTRQGFDCSGLVQYVYKHIQHPIPRTAAAQRDASKTIAYQELIAGDLIFFKTGKKTNHVGIYIGNNEFIHASSGSKKVKVDNLDKKYWKQAFVKFGRYINETI